ncbi:MAG TPA: hypothetical protein VJ600_00755 [Holophagaceae bacterium]|nr:hypothetical protein [Holophagaceae bacterium]
MLRSTLLTLILAGLGAATLPAQQPGLPGGPALGDAVTLVGFYYYGDAPGYVRGFWFYGTNGYFTSTIPAGRALVITDVYAQLSRSTSTNIQSVSLELRGGTTPLPTTPPSFTAGRLAAFEATFAAGQTTALASAHWNTGLVFTADRMPYVVYPTTNGAYATVRLEGYLVDLPATLTTAPATTPGNPGLEALSHGGK